MTKKRDEGYTILRVTQQFVTIPNLEVQVQIPRIEVVDHEDDYYIARENALRRSERSQAMFQVDGPRDPNLLIAYRGRDVTRQIR